MTAPDPRTGQATGGAERLHVPPSPLGIGPIHPSSHGNARLRAELDGEVVLDLEVGIGFLHRGFEKECESRCWDQVIPYTDRLDHHSSILANLAFALAVEKLLAVETPERCQWLRVLGAELARASDHLNRCAVTCLGLGAKAAHARALEAGDLVVDLLEALSGARVTSHWVRIGGVARDLPEGFDAACVDRVERIRTLLADLDREATRNRGFADRLKGSGLLSAEDCIGYAVTGPLLRAAGVAHDLRRVEPILVYDELDFDVPVGQVGDNYDRWLVCVEEVRQSLGIVLQCAQRLQTIGPAAVNVDGLREAASGEGAEDLRVPAGEAYAAVESANGELGFYVVSDGSERPVKVRCRPPSLLNLQPLPHMLRGGRLEDVVPTFDLVNPVAAECDR